ncbi:MAG TPA: MoaD/ThiS family protein [Candidatus Acidoferrales bacterium]|nr:MoaD/ThiS family protein [Candidatus Acidoferrales bacterium]
MAVKVMIPTPLRSYAGKRDHVDVAAKTVGEALSSLIAQHGDLRRHLYQDDGRLRSFVNVYVNDDDIRYLQKEATPLRDGDTVSIVPSIAGGSNHRHSERTEEPAFCVKDGRKQIHGANPALGMTDAVER